MSDRFFLVDYLEKYFDELSPREFYREIFPAGELEKQGQQEKGKYNALALELLPKAVKDRNAKRYVITDELEILDSLLPKENFIIISPISYIGKSRKAENARFIYAMAIDLDGLTREQNIVDLFHQIKNNHIPRPTFVVWSGTGLHLYYQFEEPVPCFSNIVKQLAAMKNFLTVKIWNKYITEFYDKPQIQSLFQGFRMVGGITKGGSRTRAFITGEKVNLEYLNDFIYDKSAQVKEYSYKSKLTKSEAAAKYPEWYERRIINKQPKGSWQCKKELYEWWLDRLKNEATVGHRYYCIMCLAVYAKKSGVSKEQLEKDAFSLLGKMEQLTTDEANHFTREDILAALEMYNDSYITFPIDTISKLSSIEIKKNKRNYRKQSTHLKIARSILEVLNAEADIKLQGRPSKAVDVIIWKKTNPNGSVKDCMKETGIARATIYKYWNCTEEEQKEMISKAAVKENNSKARKDNKQ